MKAVFYEIFGDAPRIASLPDPTPAPDGVVIKVEASGLCRSDWHGWMGHDPDIVLPHVPGHELAGTVAAVGAGVRRWRVGDRVTVPFVAAAAIVPSALGQPPGLREPVPAGLHRLGFVRRTMSRSTMPTPTWCDCRRHRLRHRREPRLPFRHLVPRRRRPGARPAGRMGGGAWLRRRRPFGDHDRQGHGCQRRRRRPDRGEARLREKELGAVATVNGRDGRCPSRRARDHRRRARMSRSMRSATPRPASTRSPTCGDAAATCRSA
jgi:hypothetical protein